MSIDINFKTFVEWDIKNSRIAKYKVSNSMEVAISVLSKY
jgi:hypothetical protein